MSFYVNGIFSVAMDYGLRFVSGCSMFFKKILREAKFKGLVNASVKRTRIFFKGHCHTGIPNALVN